MLPAPFESLAAIVAKFAAVGLSEQDVASLSGTHTIGRARCAIVAPRLYNFNGTGLPDPTLSTSYAELLRAFCGPPATAFTSRVLANLDVSTPDVFDNKYYQNLKVSKGFLTSDQVLLSTPVTPTDSVANFTSHRVLLSTTCAATNREANMTNSVNNMTNSVNNISCNMTNSLHNMTSDQVLLLMPGAATTGLVNMSNSDNNIRSENGTTSDHNITSDQVLLSTPGATTIRLVNAFASNQEAFFAAFARSMVKMGDISPLLAPNGQIRTNCHVVNV